MNGIIKLRTHAIPKLYAAGFLVALMVVGLVAQVVLGYLGHDTLGAAVFWSFWLLAIPTFMIMDRCIGKWCYKLIQEQIPDDIEFASDQKLVQELLSRKPGGVVLIRCVNGPDGVPCDGNAVVRYENKITGEILFRACKGWAEQAIEEMEAEQRGGNS